MTFIYALVDPRTDQVRYVGKSADPTRRLNDHLRRVDRNLHKQRWIRSLQRDGLAPMVRILDECTDDWAERESAWIAHFRGLGSTLTNLTDGGEGAPGRVNTPAQQAALIARVGDPEYRELLSRRVTESWSDPTIRERRCAAISVAASAPDAKKRSSRLSKGFWADEECRARMLANAAKTNATEASRAVRRKAAKASWADPEKKARRLALRNTPQYLENNSRAQRKCKADPEARAHMSRVTKSLWQDAGYRERQGAAHAAAVSTPEFRQKCSDREKKKRRERERGSA